MAVIKHYYFIMIEYRHCIVDGNWGTWGTWTECSEQCGGGIQNRTRQCDNPIPQHGGNNCTKNLTIGIDYLNGTAQEQMSNQTCNALPCPGTLSCNFCHKFGQVLNVNNSYDGTLLVISI